MSKYNTSWYTALSDATHVLSAFNWSKLRGLLNGSNREFNLTNSDLDKLKVLLAGEYYLILTQRTSHLTSWLIGILSFIKTRKWPDYTHVLMNLDLVENADEFDRFKLMEATNSGVHFSTFMEVFNCDSVCILQPRNFDKDKWSAVMKELALQLGKGYDNLFDIMDDSHVSCVEMVLDSLRADPDYKTDFANLQSMIDKVKNLTPQMYRDSSDFTVVFEAKR